MYVLSFVAAFQVGDGGGFITFVGALMIVIGIGFGCAAVGDFIMLIKIKQECITNDYLLNRNTIS